VKHADATRVVVEINGGECGAEMEVVVRDNGKGFDPARIMAAHGASMGRGLLGLRERIGLLGGSIAVESSDGAGTRLVCVLPLKG
jgi:signal transduction histidine kinase